jgi:hypothetical protein
VVTSRSVPRLTGNQELLQQAVGERRRAALSLDGPLARAGRPARQTASHQAGAPAAQLGGCLGRHPRSRTRRPRQAYLHGPASRGELAGPPYRGPRGQGRQGGMRPVHGAAWAADTSMVAPPDSSGHRSTRITALAARWFPLLAAPGAGREPGRAQQLSQRRTGIAAPASLRHALDEFRDIGHLYGVAMASNDLGLLQQLTGKYEAAAASPPLGPHD